MPISRDQAREIAHRLARGRAIDGLSDLLDPKHVEDHPAPPPVPASRDWSRAGARQRMAFLESRNGPLPHLAGRADLPDPESLRTNIENFVGMTQVPTGLIGPLRINGLHASGDFYVPLATSEGALVASFDRGAGILTRAGGAACMTTAEQVQRAPGFHFRTMAEATRFAAWSVQQFDTLREIAGRETRHGRLLDMRVQLQGNNVYLIFDFHTGDAGGQNMVTFCTAALCEHLVGNTPLAPEHWFLEANMSGDKKATALGFLQTRGRNVSAEVVVPRALVEERLHTTPERMEDYWRMSFVGGVQTGSIGVSGHLSNAIAGVFLACGQDMACVSEASVGVTRIEVTPGGDLYASVTMPNLIVGTVGGGTRLPTARECLRILGCDEDGSATRFAEIIAAVALGGELSITAALCSGDFAHGHRTLGRRDAAAAPEPREATPAGRQSPMPAGPDASTHAPGSRP